MQIAIAAFRDLQIGEVSGSDSQPCAVVLRLNRRRPEQPPLLGKPAQQPVGDPNDLFAAEDADDIIDIGKPFEQRVFLALGEATGDDHSLDVPQPFPVDHLLDHADRFLPGGFDEPAGVDDHQVGRLGLGHDRVRPWASNPSIRSESTRFFEHPRLTNEIVGVFGMETPGERRCAVCLFTKQAGIHPFWSNEAFHASRLAVRP